MLLSWRKHNQLSCRALWLASDLAIVTHIRVTQWAHESRRYESLKDESHPHESGEVVSVVFMYVFDTKVIYYEGECDGAGDMLPQAGRVGDFKISVWGKVFLEGRVCEFSGLW